MESKWKLVIFDCDGVLVDSEPISCGVVAEMSTELGHAMSTEDGIQTFAGTSMKFCISFIEKRIGKKIPFPFEEIFIENNKYSMVHKWTAEQFIGYLSTWSSTQKLIREKGNKQTSLLYKKIAEDWPTSQDAKTDIVWPLSFRIGRV